MVSIVMPAYNAEKTISASIDSVLSQTFPDWELLVIDDCSEDHTADIVKKLLQKLPPDTAGKLRLLENRENGGVSEARNLGIREARFPWIAFLDSDDLWKPEKLEKQLQLLKEHPEADILFTGSAFINEEGRRSGYTLHVPKEIRYRKLLPQNLISCSSALIRRELLIRHPFGHDEMHEDFLLWLTLLREGHRAFGVDEPLRVYRVSSSSKSGNKLRAARMTWQVYRRMGLGLPEAFFYLWIYTFRNLRKYRGIRKGFPQ